MPAGFHVDVSRVFELKRQMLACHASQRDWLLRQHGIDEYLDSQAEVGARRGGEIGVAQAEAFRQYLGHAYPHDNLLLELVKQDGRRRPSLEVQKNRVQVAATARSPGQQCEVDRAFPCIAGMKKAIRDLVHVDPQSHGSRPRS